VSAAGGLIATGESVRLTGLEPLVGDAIEALIVGTFPGPQSLTARRYYEDGRNKFWDIVAPIIGVQRSAPYERRCAALLDKGLGLWDVISACERAGSADKSITNEEPSDIGRVLQEHPGIRLIFFNGTSRKGARRYFRAFVRSGHIVVPDSVILDELPSSSSEHRVSGDLKASQWRRKFATAGFLL